VRKRGKLSLTSSQYNSKSLEPFNKVKEEVDIELSETTQVRLGRGFSVTVHHSDKRKLSVNHNKS
jgi:ribosomal protein L13E